MTTGKVQRFPALRHHSLVLNQRTQNTAPVGLDAVFYNKDSDFSRGSLWRNLLLTTRPSLLLLIKRIILI